MLFGYGIDFYYYESLVHNYSHTKVAAIGRLDLQRNQKCFIKVLFRFMLLKIKLVARMDPDVRLNINKTEGFDPFEP